jgi:hypothetical protein
MGFLGAVWGLAGIVLLLCSAIYRLSLVAVQAFSYDFMWHHWVSLFVITIFMAYAEGYKGFQKRFSPRVAARAKYLTTHPDAFHIFTGPLFCMGFFHATRKRQITSISLTAGIIVLIILIRLMPQPWRGIIDIGVVVGLAWGLLSLIIFSAQALTSETYRHSPEIPDGKQ